MICNRCMLILKPNTLQNCAKDCRKKMKLDATVCDIHGELLAYSAICRLCCPSAIVHMIDATAVLHQDEPEPDEVVLVIGEGLIAFDKFGIYRKSKKTYTHLLSGEGSNNVECGIDIPRENADEKESGPRNIISKVVNTENEVRIDITPPQGPVYAAPYLMQNIDEILNAIQNSGYINDRETYKTNLNTFNKYYKLNANGECEFGGIFCTTSYIKILAYSGGLEFPYLEQLINQVDELQTQQSNTMVGSNWVFLGCEKITFTFIKTLGRTIQSQINSYTHYPKNKRGGNCIINPNYTFKAVNGGVSESAECVRWSIRCHKMLTSLDNETREEYEKYLTSRRSGCYFSIYWEKMFEQNEVLPNEFMENDEFTIKNFKQLERLNGFPIAVYNLQKNKGDGVYLECIVAPTKHILKKFKNVEICHLLMINDTHVCYIPNMKRYMRSIFHDYCKGREWCHLCFAGFGSIDKLAFHLSEGLCFNTMSQPAKLKFKKNHYIKSRNLIDEFLPEMTIVADCEAYLKALAKNPEQIPLDMDQIIYPRERPGGKLSEHILHSIGIMGMDHDLKSTGYTMLWGEDSGTKFLDTIDRLACDYKDKIQSQRYLHPILTDADIDIFNKTTHCMFCNIDFKELPKNKKVRHHCHMTRPVYEDVIYNGGKKIKKKCIKGNFEGAACLSCNWRVTNKRNSVTVLFHNWSGYDSALLMPGFVSDREKIRKIRCTPKGATGYHMVQYKNIKIIDSCSFLQGSLASLVSLLCKKIDSTSPDKTIEKILPITVQAIKDSKFNNDVIPLLTQKLIYPHGLVKKLEDFETIVSFPSKESFYDELSETEISDDDYQLAKNVYDKSGCKNLRWLHDLYLLCDVSLLCDVWRDYNNRIFNDFGLYPANYTTGPQLSYRCALKMAKQDIKLLEDQSMYDVFNQGIIGGFCCVNKRHVVCNNVDLGENYDPNKPSETFAMLDFNNLYGDCLTDNLPCDNFKYMNEQSVKEYENDSTLFLNYDTSNDAKKGMWITVNFQIPENLKYLVDDFPLGLINTESIHPSEYSRSIGKKLVGKKLVAGHFSLENYGFHIKLLQFYLRLGCIITKVVSIIEFDQKKLFETYITHCVDKRKEAAKNDDDVLKRLYKLLANALYGKCLQSDIKYNTTNVLCETGDRYARLCGQDRFKDRRWIIKDKVAMITKNKKVIYLTAPIFIGSTVLQLSKLKNFQFHYLKVKPSCRSFPLISPYQLPAEDMEFIVFSRKYIESMELVYQDTDSLGYRIVYTELGKQMTHEFLYRYTILAKYLDKSNFRFLSKKNTACPAGELGYLKSEIADDIPLEIICLTPKCYSILSKNRATGEFSRKFALRSCPTKIAGKVYSHETFRKILEDDEYTVPAAVSNQIRRDAHSGINTIRESKVCLSLLDFKRYWVSKNVSYAYGHPITYQLGYRDNHIVPAGGTKITNTCDITETEIENDMDSIATELDPEDFEISTSEVVDENTCFFDETHDNIVELESMETDITPLEVVNNDICFLDETDEYVSDLETESCAGDAIDDDGDILYYKY